jgi:hypothetical protein
LLFSGASVKEPVMNILSQERQIQILNTLVEGVSIRSTERMTNTHRDTILRLLVSVGDHCQRFLDERLRGFRSQHLQLDEIWTFVRKKERRLSELERLNPDIGDQYVFVAIDAETKLIPNVSCRQARQSYRAAIHDGSL